MLTHQGLQFLVKRRGPQRRWWRRWLQRWRNRPGPPPHAAGRQSRHGGTAAHQAGAALCIRPKPVVAAGRVLLLHPLVGQGVRAGLPAECPLELRQIDPSRAAAQRACRLWAGLA
ncbi:MAG: hypothetical protein ACKOGB_01310 [Betaproteobacteria bacterium]